MSDPEYECVGAERDFSPGRGRRVQVGRRAVAVFRLPAGWFAVADACPHQGDPLHPGAVDGRVVRCKGHDWAFDLADGRCLAGRPDAAVACFPVRVEEGLVAVGRRRCRGRADGDRGE